MAVAPAYAVSSQTFVIPAESGYGIVDCLASGSVCGKAMADAWCGAHGLGPSRAFGQAADLTASIGTAASNVEQDAVVISCAP